MYQLNDDQIALEWYRNLRRQANQERLARLSRLARRINPGSHDDEITSPDR